MALRFPKAVNLGDITTIDWTTCGAQPDIICGGFPCQDISLAGKGAGINDNTRSGLWRFYADAIRVLRPRLVVVENVTALLARGLDRVLGNLAACGYDAEWDCIPAASVGAPHRRDRIFIIAHPLRSREWIIRERHATGIGTSGERRYASEPPAAGTASMADAASARLEGAGVSRRSAIGGSEFPNADSGQCNTRAGELGQGWWPEPRHCSWWVSEPSMGRVAHGIPHRVDRLKCLGNAVVPQVAEHVGKIALERIYTPDL